MMRLGFDIRPFLKNETGVGIYFKNLLFSLSAIDRENEYHLFSSSWKDRFLSQKIPPFKKLFFHDFHIPVKAVNFFWQNLGFPSLDFLLKAKLDLTHSPTPLILPSKGKKIVTVYDLFFMDRPQHSDKEARNRFRKKIKSALEKADGVITISHFTRDQLLERFLLDPGKIKVIHLGLNKNIYSRKNPEEIKILKKRFNFPSPFILFVGALERRKNLLALLEAFKILRHTQKDLFLVLAGKEGADTSLIKKKVIDIGIGPWVKLLGYCDEKKLCALYRLADLFVYPSFHEGFGLPLIEAMASDLPVCASRNSAILEIGKDAIAYFDPYSPEDMAGTIIKVLESSSLQKELISKGQERVLDFDWNTTAKSTLEFYKKVMSR